jgi:hypothetical protein
MIYCDLYDKNLRGSDKCEGCQFRKNSRSESELKQVHDAVNKRKQKKKVATRQTVASAISGVVG